MTHLVQAACVNLADVRRFQAKNEALKYFFFKNSHFFTTSISLSLSLYLALLMLKEKQWLM
jgi:hypothetical protein